MKLKYIFFLWLLPLLAVQAQVSVQVLVPPPYSPYLYDYQAQYADRNAIVLTNTTRQTINVMLRGELTGRNNGIRVYTGPNYRPKNVIELLPGQPQRFTLAESNQDFLDQKNLEVVGVDDATRTQVLTTGLLPPGSYDLCILAYRYENGQPIGSPFRGCTFLTIAYLETPRLIQPLCGREVMIRPNEPNQTLFSWNPPVGNSNGARLVYDFYLVKVPPGQNPNDAINNAIDRRVGNPFIERDLSTTFFNYGVAEPPLSEGLYVWRVVARDPDRRTVFQNQGRSEFCQFTARNSIVIATTEVVKNPVLVQPPAAQKPVILSGPMQTMNLAAPGVSPCKDVVAPANNAPVAANYLNQTVKIGKFDLTIDDVTAVGNVYSGKGRIRWNGVPIRVSYTNIQINADKQVIAGWANGIDDAFRMPGVDLGSTDLNGLQQLDGSNLKAYAENLKNNLFDQAKSAIAVPLPLGYDAGSGLIGINYMRFTPTGADMGIVFNMELPEADSYLALAGVGICMDPNKIIPNNVLLYLVKDLKVPSTPLTFLKGNLAPANPSGTFAEWNANDGLKRVHGELGLNLGSGFLQLDDGNGNTLPGDVTATLKADFTKWADWTADVQMPPAFGLSALSGVTLKGVSVTYDHSDLRNPAGFAPPLEYTGERGPTFQGVYLAEMQVLLPKSFLDQKGNRTGFAAKGCLFTSGEFTGRLAPATKPLLDYNTGSLGKWGFSIDDFEVLFVQNRFERGGMNGKIQFPISNDYFNYTTTLRDNFKELQFLVQPKPGGYKIPLWAADMNIIDGSQILVGLKNGAPQMDMRLHGNITINSSTVPKVVSLVLPNLYFTDLTVSNMRKPGDGAAGGNEVFVNPGNWELVGGIFKKSPPPTPAPGARQSNGPSEPEMTDEISGEMLAGGEGGLAGFPIEIAKPTMFVEGSGFGVELGAYVSLGETSANIANASGFVRILGEINLANKRPQPALKDVYPRRLGIKGDFGGGTVDAAIDFYKEDSRFGTGFKGVGMVNMPALAEVDATVQFGKVNGFYYAYADASVVIAGGIPIAPPTPLVINGFKGGFYYNMVPDKWVMPTTVDLDPKNPPPPAPVNPEIGHTNSKTGYTPIRNGWGIKAGVFLAVADRHLMNSLVEVEASFIGSALSSFLLKGQANVMDTDAKLETKGDAMMTAMAEFKHVVAQKSYVFSIEIKGQWPGVPVPLTIPFQAYFDPQHYHVKLGDPFAQRIEASILNVDLSLVKASLAAKAYVAFGNDLPGMPALPAEVERFLGTGENSTNSAAVDLLRRDEFSQVATSGVTYSNGPKSAPVGGDFMVLLGAGVDANLKVSVFPLTINATGKVGFDAALFHDAMCDNGTKAAGLFGWYGKADLYAYLAGSIDIEVDLIGISGSFQLCKLEAGALLRGGVPNPTWAEGKIRAKGNILDGLVDFNASVNIVFGEKCQPHYTGDPLAQVLIIQELRPTSDKPVATDATLAAVFNISMNREYTVRLPDDTEKTYQFGLDSYRLIYTDKANKLQEFKGLHEPVWADNDQLLLLPVSSGQLMSRLPHTFTVTANIKEKVSDGYGGSKFDYVYDATKKPRTQSKSITFTTGDQYDGIRFQDVEYQYPLDGQLYTLKGQIPQGLVAGSLPNEALEKPDYRLEAVFVPKEPGPSLRVPFSYHSGIISGSKSQTSKVVFAWPAGLQNEKTYRLELHRIYNAAGVIGTGIQPMGTKVSLPVSVGVKNDRSLNQLENKTTTGIQGTATTRKNTLSGDLQMSGGAIVADKILYSFNFRTSRYNTFAEKIAAMRFAPASYTNGTNPARADYLTFDLDPTGSVENFEDSELFGYRSAKGSQPAMLESRPLPPNSHAYPYEDWVLKNVYDPLFKFNLQGGTDISFNLFTELNDGGWMTNFSATAMQNRRGQVPLSLKAGSTITALSSGPTTRQAGSATTSSTSQQAGLSASSTLAIKPLLSAQSGSQSTIKLVPAYQLDLFALNDEPDRAYKFFVQRDRIGFFDWQAVNNFGSSLYAAREQAKKVADASIWQSLFNLPMMEPVTVSASSPTITLSTSYRYLSDMPNELIDRYPIYPGMIAPNNPFKGRFVGSTGGVLLRYIPYSGGPRQEVSKEFLFKGNPASPASSNPR